MNEAKWAYICINNFKLIFYYSLDTVFNNYFVELFFHFSFICRQKLKYSKNKYSIREMALVNGKVYYTVQ